jgi:hypothetical protein
MQICPQPTCIDCLGNTIKSYAIHQQHRRHAPDGNCLIEPAVNLRASYGNPARSKCVYPFWLICKLSESGFLSAAGKRLRQVVFGSITSSDYLEFSETKLQVCFACIEMCRNAGVVENLDNRLKTMGISPSIWVTSVARWCRPLYTTVVYYASRHRNESQFYCCI